MLNITTALLITLLNSPHKPLSPLPFAVAFADEIAAVS